MRIPAKFAPQLFALLMSFAMALVMTAFITWVNTGFADGFISRWARAFFMAWPLAMICVLLFAGRVRAIVAKLTAQ
ncbi:MAG: DUF2798 domain-containing protein [Gallionella sp.]